MVEPGELNPVSDSSLKVICREGCHFSCVPLKRSQFELVCWVFCLFIWLVLMFWFFFPSIMVKFKWHLGIFFICTGDIILTRLPSIPNSRTVRQHLCSLNSTVRVGSDCNLFGKHQSYSVSMERHHARAESLTHAAEPAWCGGTAQCQVKC